jgi:ABC-type polysaccharide/polyol phosphate export permease
MAVTAVPRPRNGFLAAVDDLIQGAMLWRLWLRMGLFETKNRYIRTILGPFWMASTTIAMGLALAFVRTGATGGAGSASFGSLLPYVVSGVLIWSLVGGGHNEGAGIFTGASGTMRSTPLPLSFHVFMQLWRMVIVFAHGVVGYYVIVLAFGVAHIPHWTLPFGFLIDLFAIFPSFYLLALVSARYRDIGHATVFIFSILFFLSPIFWQEDNATGLRALFVHYNPFAHLVNLIRYPLMGQRPTWTMVQWVIGFGGVCWTLLLIFLPMVRRRVIFWL